jgi:hypothetical protein
MKSFSTVLDMVVSETYSSNKQTSKRHQSKNLIDTGIPCSFLFSLGGGSIGDVGPLTKVITYH